jgi:hypothetical protein
LITSLSSVIREDGAALPHQAGTAPRTARRAVRGLWWVNLSPARRVSGRVCFFRDRKTVVGFFTHNLGPSAPKGMAGYGG